MDAEDHQWPDLGAQPGAGTAQATPLAQVYYANLPKYLGAAFPLPGPKDINTAHQNDLVLPQASLTYLPPGPRVIQSFEPTLTPHVHARFH